MMYQIDYQIISSSGNRSQNEDCAKAIVSEKYSMFVLCDGLGGHRLGDIASKTVVNVFAGYFQNQKETEISEKELSIIFETAQIELLEKQEQLSIRDSLRTTAVVLQLDEKSAIWGHIGDSRLYVFHNNRLKLRTLDHSVPQILALTGQIKEKQIRQHPARNQLLSALGEPWNDSKKYEISRKYRLRRKQAFLLCSDGFWENIQEKAMCRLLKQSHSANEWVSLMCEEIRRNSSAELMDNYTAIAIILS